MLELIKLDGVNALDGGVRDSHEPIQAFSSALWENGKPMLSFSLSTSCTKRHLINQQS